MAPGQGTLQGVLILGLSNRARSPGWVARRGTFGTLANSIIMNFEAGAIDVRDDASAAGATADPPSLLAMNSLFFDNGPGGTDHFPAETADADNDSGFDGFPGR